MRTSIATVSLSGTLVQKLRAAAAAGFDGVEIFEQDLVVAPESPERIRELAAWLGLSLDLYQPFRDAVGVSQEDFARVLHRAEAKFKLMGRLGMDLMLVCSTVAGGVTADDAAGHELTARQLGELADAAAAHGIRLAYEALAWGAAVNDVDHSWRIVRAADRENLGVCLDSFHILSRDWPTEGILDIPAQKLFFLQLADAPPMSLDVLSWSRHHRVFPGEGGFALARFLDTVLRAGYTGPLSLEIFNDSYRQTNVYRTAQEAHRSLVWLQDRVAALRAQRGEDERLPADAALTRLPQAQAPTGIQWAEVRGQRTDGLQALLAQLGFRPRGRHRTKPVRLWEQGAARVVLNVDHWAREEASLASLAVQVPSAQATARRCRELGFREVARLAHDDEQRFPAFLAPDETEVFLTEASEGQPAWVAEFDRPDVGAAPAAQPEADAALIAGIDHVNLAQPRHYQAESMLFYRAALGLERRAATDVPGPDGLISSQVVRTEDGSVRLPLNVAPDLSAHPGRGHVAFACRDILALARRAREAGLGFLPVPQNYYEDLAARFDLPASRLADLRELDLMYDRDERGEFLHFYTRTVGQVFFEVVQRLDGYDGYGGPDAPVRLAAQARLADGL